MDLADQSKRKRRIGEKFRRREKQVIANVFNYFSKSMNVSAAVTETSKAVCCSERSMYIIKKEMESGQFASPKKRRKIKPVRENSRMKTYDECTQSLVRRKVHNYFIQNVPPTVNLILAAINNDEDLPNFTRATLQRFLHDIGFEHKKVVRKSILIERDDIIRWRHIFLLNIKRYRGQGTPMFCFYTRMFILYEFFRSLHSIYR